MKKRTLARLADRHDDFVANFTLPLKEETARCRIEKPDTMPSEL